MFGSIMYRLDGTRMSGTMIGGIMMGGTKMGSSLSLSGREYLPGIRVHSHTFAQKLARIFQLTFVLAASLEFGPIALELDLPRSSQGLDRPGPAKTRQGPTSGQLGVVPALY